MTAPARAAGRVRTPRTATIPALVLLGILAAAFLVPPFLPDPLRIDLPGRLAPPSAEHPLGCDELGRDVLARLLVAARTSILLGAVAAGVATALGSAAASLAWLARRPGDRALVAATDLLLAIPGSLLALAMAAALGPGRINTVVALSATGWVPVARLVRTRFRGLASEPFVEAAEVAGSRRPRTLARHLLPHCAPLLLAHGVLLLAAFVLTEGALSFLGLGVPPPAPSWGGMLDTARGHLLDAPHLATAPAAALVLTVISVGAVADRLDRRAG